MRSVSSALAVSRMTGVLLVARMKPAQRQAVLARHHDVEQRDVDRMGGERSRRAAAASAALETRKPFLRQIGGERIENVALVVDEQDVRFAGHGCLL